jgi:hypothetical protein
MRTLERLVESSKPFIVLDLIVYDDVDLLSLLFNILSCPQARADKQFGNPLQTIKPLFTGH